jgi:2-iminobutanoate/2-iminopropanoate deaminase
MNDVYSEYLGGAKPARSTVAVSELPRGALVEIDLVALA